LLLALQLPLILNPGYLSFDELQWWARADVADFFALPWVSWTDLHAFQYRPLTFNLWLVAAHALAAHAWAMHALFVAVGTLDAVLLAACLRRLRARPLTANIAAVAFVLSPCAAYTHGWTGTLADLLVALVGLLGALVLLGDAATPARRRDAMALAALAALALLAKESAIVLPALWLALATTRSRSPRLLAERIAPAALVVLIYLAVRLPTLWFGSGNDGYAWQLAHVPRRLAEYALFPWLPPLFEIAPILDKGAARLLLAAACCSIVLFALLRTNWRYAAAWALLIAVALAPVLVLSRSFDHYAYLASLVGIGVVAMAWQDCSLGARWLIVVAGSIACVHGVQVMLRMREVGTIERRFHVSLVAALAHGADTPLRIVASRPGDAWMLERWIDHVPRYAGVAVAGLVTIGNGPTDAPVLTMEPDGSLLRAQDGLHQRP
jgi:hypothetical protein